METDLKNFFEDVVDILKGDINSKKIIPSIQQQSPKDKQRTNVIYLNTDCNLRCAYCYESKSKDGLPDQADCTPDMIDGFLEEISQREQGKISTIVIMGGEPFLQFELIRYTIIKAIEFVKDKKHSGWGLSLITNATLFTDKRLDQLKYLIDLGKKYKTNLNLEISYDGSGHFLRKYPDGTSSKDLVEKSIFKLIDKGIEFKISYTTHAGNYKTVEQDCIEIFEKFKSKYFLRITVGYAYQILDTVGEGIQYGKRLKKEFIPIANKLFKKYKIPICDHTCGVCKICDKDFAGNSYLSPTTGITYADKNTEHEFQQF